MKSGFFIGGPGRLMACMCLLSIMNPALVAADETSDSAWRVSSNAGQYDRAVEQADSSGLSPSSSLSTLLAEARKLGLAEKPAWRALLHYKRKGSGRRESQADARHFFLSVRGKRDPQAELEATLAALFSTAAKPPLRLSAYCRFIARRVWLAQHLNRLNDLVPEQICAEFEQFRTFVDASQLTLVFPTAYPNSPSSAFGHTLLRIDKANQSHESRLLNMSINFAAEVPAEVSSSAYAIKGLAGGFPGRYRMLPYHMKLREYGQIQNRDTWEYPLDLSQDQVDAVLRHAYEMLIADFDYFFLSENCSYHLLSLLDVAVPDNPLTDSFGLWTIPVDTIRVLQSRGLTGDGLFVPSSIRTIKARREALPEANRPLALQALRKRLPSIESQLGELPVNQQAGVLDLLSDYQRYEQLRTNPNADALSDNERAVLSKRSKLGVGSTEPQVRAPSAAPSQGHRTGRIALRARESNATPDTVELSVRPAYHDYRDPGIGYGSRAAIELGNIGIALDLETDDVFLSKVTLLSIESIEPRGELFKPISWHTRLDWRRASARAKHRFTFNVGAGVAFQRHERAPIVFGFFESDVIDDTAFERRTALRLGVSGGVHWELSPRIRAGAEVDYRRRVGDSDDEAKASVWASAALGEQWAVVLDGTLNKRTATRSTRDLSVELRRYF